MLDDGSPGAMARYSHLTGRSVNSDAISFYRLAWTLTDVAAYTGQLRSAHRHSRDTERALAALRKSLEPEPLTKPGPFRHRRR
jgi:spectinomycin phosphotransferase